MKIIIMKITMKINLIMLKIIIAKQENMKKNIMTIIIIIMMI